MTQTIHPIRLAMPLRLGFVNCYLLENQGRFLLVDTGSPNARNDLDQKLAQLGCLPESLQLIVLTHGDLDHIGNAAYLSRKYDASTAMHFADAAMAEQGDIFLDRGKANLLVRKLVPLLFGFRKAERFSPDICLEVQYDFTPFGFQAKSVHLPGHSKGSIGILTAQGDLLCGDLVENIKAPTLNSLQDDKTAALASLGSLEAMGVRMVYPGHGEPFLLQELAGKDHSSSPAAG